MKRKLNVFMKNILLIFISIITFFPFLWMVSNALKDKQEIFEFPPKLIPSVFHFENFINVFTETSFLTYFSNSMIVATIIVAFQMFSVALMSYALVMMDLKYKKIIIGIIMATYMLPSAATYIPCYIFLADLNLIDTLTGVIVSDLGSVFGIFLMYQSFMQVDKSYVEAGRLDGASEFKILWKIVFPITKPTFVIFGLISFVTCYNSYMYPSLITKSPEKFLVSAGLRQYFIEGGAYGMNWPQIMAMSTFIVLPLLLLFFIGNKFFMNSVGGGVKE